MPRHMVPWSVGRRQMDRLFGGRVLPGRHLDWEAWEAMTQRAVAQAVSE